MIKKKIVPPRLVDDGKFVESENLEKIFFAVVIAISFSVFCASVKCFLNLFLKKIVNNNFDF